MPTTEAGQAIERLSADQVDDLLVCLVRIPVLYLEAASVLREEHFSGMDETANRIIWRQLVKLHKAHGSIPSRFILESSVNAEIASLPEDIRDRAYSRSDSLLDIAYAVSDEEAASDELYRFSSELLLKFLRERDVIDRLREWIDGLNGKTPVSMGDAVRVLQDRVVAVESVASDPFEDMLLTRPVDNAFHVEPCGVSFLDSAMGGGLLLRECFGVLGAQGSGKTMLGTQVSVQMVCSQYAKSLEQPGYEPGHVYFISYEQPRYQISMRAVSVAARIPLYRLRQAGYGQKNWIDNLSTPGHLLDYERSLEVIGGMAMSERERYENYIPCISKYWHVAGFSGTKADGPVPSGNGMVEEIAAVLEKRQRLDRHKVVLVVVDYALLACRRHIISRGLDPNKELRHYLGVFGNSCKSLLAENFGCSVMVLSQLSGEANSRSPTARVTLADGAECKTFSENLAYNFALGTKQHDNGCVMFHSTKTRHGGDDESHYILRFNELGHLVDVSKEFDFDSGKFVPKSFTARVPPPVALPSREKSLTSSLAATRDILKPGRGMR